MSKATEAADAIDKAIEKVKDYADETGRGPGGREASLAITQLQQGRHWFRDSIEVANSPQRSDD